MLWEISALTVGIVMFCSVLSVNYGITAHRRISAKNATTKTKNLVTTVLDRLSAVESKELIIISSKIELWINNPSMKNTNCAKDVERKATIACNKCASLLTAPQTKWEGPLTDVVTVERTSTEIMNCAQLAKTGSSKVALDKDSTKLNRNSKYKQDNGYALCVNKLTGRG